MSASSTTTAKSIPRRFMSLLSQGKAGLAGQGLTFVAALLPIGFDRFDEMAVLLVVGAVASIATAVLSLNVAGSYPRIRDDAEAVVALKAAAQLVGTAVVAGVIAAGAMA